MSESTISTQEARPSRAPVAFGDRGIVINQYDDLVRFAETVSKSGLAPKGMESPQSIFVAVQMGLEVGLSPMAALQNIAVVNGRPTIWGDAQLAVCRGTGEMEAFEEWFEVGGARTSRNPSEYKDDTAAVCRIKRLNGGEVESAFSVADAKRASLWGKSGPWTQYPFRMLRNRARSFALRDSFGDALKGFRNTEEAMDMPRERDVTATASEPKLFQPKALPEPKKSAIVEESQNLLEVAPVSLVEQVSALLRRDKLKWPAINEMLVRNGVTESSSDTHEDADEETLSQAVLNWTALVALIGKGAGK